MVKLSFPFYFLKFIITCHVVLLPVFHGSPPDWFHLSPISLPCFVSLCQCVCFDPGDSLWFLASCFWLPTVLPELLLFLVFLFCPLRICPSLFSVSFAAHIIYVGIFNSFVIKAFQRAILSIFLLWITVQKEIPEYTLTHLLLLINYIIWWYIFLK